MNIVSRGFCGLLCGAATLFACPAAVGQHGGDVFVGRTLEGRLRRGGFDPQERFIPLIPVSGILRGWSDNSPGFDRVINDDPAENLYRLASGARIWLEIVAVDPAFRAIGIAAQIIDAPGERTLLGDQDLHAHVTWHINSADPRFDPTQCVWEATFVLRDLGTTHYADSEPFTLRFTNLPLRPADGDFDRDRDVDLDDHARLAECLSGVEVQPRPASGGCFLECLNAFDFNGDHDVDLEDAARFYILFTGD
jgi:hypothetical protein